MNVSNNKILLSIVVPTKNRYDTLRVLVTSLLASSSFEFELVIQDNSDDNSQFVQELLELDDCRVQYNHVAGWIPVTENCDLGITSAAGKYVCMLGDDDGILIDSAVNFVRLMIINNWDAAVTNNLSYNWPNTEHAVWGKAFAGQLALKKYSYGTRLLDTEYELEKVLATGACMTLGNLPCVYHGLVSAETLNKLKIEAGTYFPGPSPDMANAIGLVKYIENYVFADIPLIVSGHSGASTGGQGQRKEHHGSIEAQLHLPADTSEKWSDRIPFFWSGATIYAESARRALDATNMNSNKKINYCFLYACCLIYEKSYFKETMKAINSNLSLIRKLTVYPKIIFYYIQRSAIRIRQFAFNFVSKKFRYSDTHSADDISVAIDLINTKYGLFDKNRII